MPAFVIEGGGIFNNFMIVAKISFQNNIILVKVVLY